MLLSYLLVQLLLFALALAFNLYPAPTSAAHQNIPATLLTHADKAVINFKRATVVADRVKPLLVKPIQAGFERCGFFGYGGFNWHMRPKKAWAALLL
jgi:hypothetical protein